MTIKLFCPFPRIPEKTEEHIVNGTCRVFNHSDSKLEQPVLIYLPIMKKVSELNNPDLEGHVFEQYNFPGIVKTPLSSVDLSDYPTKHTALSEQQVVNLMALMHYNVCVNRDVIREAVAARTMAKQ